MRLKASARLPLHQIFKTIISSDSTFYKLYSDIYFSRVLFKTTRVRTVFRKTPLKVYSNLKYWHLQKLVIWTSCLWIIFFKNRYSCSQHFNSSLVNLLFGGVFHCKLVLDFFSVDVIMSPTLTPSFSLISRLSKINCVNINGNSTAQITVNVLHILSYTFKAALSIFQWGQLTNIDKNSYCYSTRLSQHLGMKCFLKAKTNHDSISQVWCTFGKEVLLKEDKN